MKYIVSDEYRFIYFVVPKVACSSIKTALLPLFGIDGPHSRVHKLFDDSGHQINKQRLLSGLEDDYRDYFKFAFVRNPWDRLVSCHSEKLRPGGPGFKHPAKSRERFYPGMPFAEFIETVNATPDEGSNLHFSSQYRVVCGSGEDRPILTDFVGYFENLEEDFTTVVEKIGAPELQLPHLLRSESRESRPYADFYDERLRELVGERFRDDVGIFGYSF